MANEVHGILFGNVYPVTGDTYEAGASEDEAFLRNVITPIYQVLKKVCNFLIKFSPVFPHIASTKKTSFLCGKRKSGETKWERQAIPNGETMMI